MKFTGVDFAKWGVYPPAIFATSHSFLFRVIFLNTVIKAPLNNSLWSVWHADQPNTDNVFFADFNSTGSGIKGARRANFSTILTAKQAAQYSISSAVGNDFSQWVDTSYIVWGSHECN